MLQESLSKQINDVAKDWAYVASDMCHIRSALWNIVDACRQALVALHPFKDEFNERQDVYTVSGMFNITKVKHNMIGKVMKVTVDDTNDRLFRTFEKMLEKGELWFIDFTIAMTQFLNLKVIERQEFLKLCQDGGYYSDITLSSSELYDTTIMKK